MHAMGAEGERNLAGSFPRERSNWPAPARGTYEKRIRRDAVGKSMTLRSRHPSFFGARQVAFERLQKRLVLSIWCA